MRKREIFTGSGLHSFKRTKIIKPSEFRYNGFFSNRSDRHSYNPDKYIYSVTTTVPAVELEDDGHTIKKGYEPFINTWGDAIPSSVLNKFAETFLVSKNYFEHIHLKELIKGDVLDYNLYTHDFNGIPVLLCDTLLATDIKDKKLSSMILSGRLNQVSQGCLSDHLKCSKCGKVFPNNDEVCDHLRYDSNTWYDDEKGMPRVIANVIGNEMDEDSFTFFDVSWVLRGAFYIAILQDILNHNKDIMKSKLGPVDNFYHLSKDGSLENSIPELASMDVSIWDISDIYDAYVASESGASSFNDFSKILIEKDRDKFVSSAVDLKIAYDVINSVDKFKKGDTSMNLSEKVSMALSAASHKLGPDASKEDVKSLATELASLSDDALQLVFEHNIPSEMNSSDEIDNGSEISESSDSEELDSSGDFISTVTPKIVEMIKEFPPSSIENIDKDIWSSSVDWVKGQVKDEDAFNGKLFEKATTSYKILSSAVSKNDKVIIKSSDDVEKVVATSNEILEELKKKGVLSADYYVTQEGKLMKQPKGPYGEELKPTIMLTSDMTKVAKRISHLSTELKRAKENNNYEAVASITSKLDELSSEFLSMDVDEKSTSKGSNKGSFAEPSKQQMPAQANPDFNTTSTPSAGDSGLPGVEGGGEKGRDFGSYNQTTSSDAKEIENSSETSESKDDCEEKDSKEVSVSADQITTPDNKEHKLEGKNFTTPKEQDMSPKAVVTMSDNMRVWTKSTSTALSDLGFRVGKTTSKKSGEISISADFVFPGEKSLASGAKELVDRVKRLVKCDGIYVSKDGTKAKFVISKSDDNVFKSEEGDDAPMDDVPMDDAPMDDAPMDDAPMDDAPTDDIELGEGGEKKIEISITDEEVEQARQSFYDNLSTNAVSPESPTEEELSAALDAVEQEYGPEIVTAFLTNPDTDDIATEDNTEVVEESEPDTDMESDVEEEPTMEAADQIEIGEKREEKPYEKYTKSGEPKLTSGDEPEVEEAADSIETKEEKVDVEGKKTTELGPEQFDDSDLDEFDAMDELVASIASEDGLSESDIEDIMDIPDSDDEFMSYGHTSSGRRVKIKKLPKARRQAQKSLSSASGADPFGFSEFEKLVEEEELNSKPWLNN